jgi:C4-dicarboxylate-specific signal transduction histidine kinase
VAAERLAAAVRGLQTISRGSPDAFSAVDIQSALDPAIAVIGHQLRNRARLLKAVPAMVPAVWGSACRLCQLFTNLLINAAHAIPEGRPEQNEVEVAVRSDGGSLVVAVRDTGTGMTRETCRRIFEPFFTTKPPGMGTGLGLPICQAIAREHGGYIEVDSNPDRGSTFRVFLPIAGEELMAGEASQSRRRPAIRDAAAVARVFLVGGSSRALS